MSAAKPMQQAAILQYAKQLHLPTLGDQFVSLAEEAVKEKQSHLTHLLQLATQSVCNLLISREGIAFSAKT